MCRHELADAARRRRPGSETVGKLGDAPLSRAMADITSVAFLLVPSFSMIAFSSAVEPLRLANRIEGHEAFSWRVLSVDGKPVSASNGVEVAVHGSFADLGGATAAIVCCATTPVGLMPWRDWKRRTPAST